MGNCTYRLWLHGERAPAAGRIRAGGDPAGWIEPLRVGFWGGPGEGRQVNCSAKKEELILQAGCTRSVSKRTSPAPFQACQRKPGTNQRLWCVSAGASDTTSIKRVNTSEMRKGFWRPRASARPGAP